MEIKNFFKSPSESVETAASEVGKNLSRTEQNAFLAYSIEDKPENKSQIAELAKQFGMSDADAKKMSLDGLRLLAKRALDKAQSVYETLSQLFQVKKRAQDSVINNIGR